MTNEILKGISFKHIYLQFGSIFVWWELGEIRTIGCPKHDLQLLLQGCLKCILRPVSFLSFRLGSWKILISIFPIVIFTCFFICQQVFVLWVLIFFVTSFVDGCRELFLFLLLFVLFFILYVFIDVFIILLLLMWWWIIGIVIVWLHLWNVLLEIIIIFEVITRIIYVGVIISRVVVWFFIIQFFVQFVVWFVYNISSILSYKVESNCSIDEFLWWSSNWTRMITLLIIKILIQQWQWMSLPLLRLGKYFPPCVFTVARSLIYPIVWDHVQLSLSYFFGHRTRTQFRNSSFNLSVFM